MQTTIDKDVPVPEDQESLNDQFPLAEMDVGDSIEFPVEYRSYVSAKASTIKRRKGLSYTVRRVSEGECRVWRIS